MGFSKTTNIVFKAMKRFFLLILLCTHCSKIEQSNRNCDIFKEAEQDMIKRDLILSEWYIYQMSAADQLAPGEYYFVMTKFNPKDIILIQKQEIINRRKNNSSKELTQWIEDQKQAIFVLNKDRKILSKKIDEKNISELLSLLYEQEVCLKTMNCYSDIP